MPTPTDQRNQANQRSTPLTTHMGQPASWQPQHPSLAQAGQGAGTTSSDVQAPPACAAATVVDGDATARVTAISAIAAPSPIPAFLPDTAPCPCGRTAPTTKRQPRPLPFGQCCGPLLRGEQTAADAQALMRSRYSAYVLGDVAYLRHTWHPSTCPPALSLDSDVQWLGLKIERYLPINDGRAEVVFVARYRSQGRAHRLHEHSRFVREQGRWLYLDAIE